MSLRLPVGPLDSFAAGTTSIPLPLLITGAAGVPGYNALAYFGRQHPGQVVAVRRVDNWPLIGPGIVPLDMDDRDSMARLFDRHQFRAVLSAEGTCKLKSCEYDPVMARRVNVETLASLLDVAAERDVRMVHVSIDLVYAGRDGGGYLEDDPTDPVTIYGQTMAEGEQLILSRCPGACVLRISLPMGPSFNGHAGAIDWIQSRFKQNKPATLYFDEVRTPTYTECLNGVFEAALTSDISGVFHAGGPRRLSLYQIGQIVNRVGGYRPQDLKGCMRHEAGPMPPRAGDVTMNSRKLADALGFDPFDAWPLAPEHVPNHDLWHVEGPRGSPELLEQVLYRKGTHLWAV